MQPHVPDPNLVHLTPECVGGGQTYGSCFKDVLGRRNSVRTWWPVLSPTALPHGVEQGPGAYHGLADEEQQEGFLNVVLWAVEAARHKRRCGCSTALKQHRWPTTPATLALLPWSQHQPR